MSAIPNFGNKPREDHFRQILGVRFFIGGAAEALARMASGGLLVVPAAPALKDLPMNAGYREALLNADLAIADSGFMVLIWNWIEGDSVRKLSGLAYLREFLRNKELCKEGTFWIMPSASSAKRNLEWLKSISIDVSPQDVYTAPMYSSGDLRDPDLLEILRERRPRHIITALGGGTQERLGLYIKRNVDFSPGIHCIGAAIGFLSGDQVRIPVWADKLYLGWLFRCLGDPRRYLSRYWDARNLLPLLLKHRRNLPFAQRDLRSVAGVFEVPAANGFARHTTQNISMTHKEKVEMSAHAKPCPVDLSTPDNSEYVKERSIFLWAVWHFIGFRIVRSDLLPFSPLKRLVLRLFGARIGKGVYIKPGVRVKFPWLLSIGDHSWIGEDVWIDNLAQVTIGAHVCISQAAYLCTGNHDWSSHNMKLFRRPITLKEGCWIGARANVCPGVTVGAGAVASVGSVVTRDIPPFEVWGGNPAVYVRDRRIELSA
jgi:acetyltransferase-like isoleucine patch superfamily enzyme/UDP-N-acetyl-D-mannosaminuronic acid transferase (WecB/TagA/CpsF family)